MTRYCYYKYYARLYIPYKAVTSEMHEEKGVKRVSNKTPLA